MHAEREPSAATEKNDRFAAEQGSGKGRARRLRFQGTRQRDCGAALDEPSGDESRERIGDEVSGGGAEEARGAGNAEGLKDREPRQTFEEVESQREGAAARPEEDSDEQNAERLAGDWH